MNKNNNTPKYGKGSKSRVSNIKKYQDNYDDIFRKENFGLEFKTTPTDIFKECNDQFNKNMGCGCEFADVPREELLEVLNVLEQNHTERLQQDGLI
jgi:hypothetical protein